MVRIVLVKLIWFAMGLINDSINIRLICSLKHSRILLLDDLEVNIFKNVFGSEQFNILKREKKLYIAINIKTIFLVIKYFIKTRSLYIAAVMSYDPRICITLRDNDRDANRIFKHLYPTVRCISIQNGQRLTLWRSNQKQVGDCFDYYFSWSKKDIERLKNYNIRAKHFIATGSLRNEDYKRQMENKSTFIKKEIDILWISQYRKTSVEEGCHLQSSARDALIEIIDYCRKERLTLKIAMISRLNNTHEENEKKYFVDLGVSENDLIGQSRYRYNTYLLSDASVVTTGFISSALWESFGRGNKTLFINYTNDINYSFPVSGIWTYDFNSKDTLCERLKKLYFGEPIQFNEKNELMDYLPVKNCTFYYLRYVV